ncbi:putative periplasmic serine endoprotease DegP-like protein [Planctomycetales bacterium]|nr:putative periplasmic serine endoprotease DegP-like protein [Planctomycetales bacterium]GHT02490.1 putative periplasmic serine endoprotease DegP-like protein [Planctomycetales bacterium]
MRKLILLALLLCPALLAADIGDGFAAAAEVSTPKQMSKMLGKAFAEAAKKVKPAVVYIETLSPVAPSAANPFDFFNDEFTRRFFNLPNRTDELAKAMGSGFIIAANGLLVTNAHVVKNAKTITVKLADGSEFSAAVVGDDEKNDVALLKIDAQNLPFLEFGDSDQIEVGEWVLAIGSPFGLTQTVTSGIVSAKGRNSTGISEYEDFIQTDAAINPGNSGGPLVNLDGEVVGLNTAIFSRTGGYMGIGFSIPSNAVGLIVKQLREHGEFTPGYFGAIVAERLDKIGLHIEQIIKESPAEAAGLRIGDVILSVNDRPVNDIYNFNYVVSLAGAEAKFSVVFRRGERTQTCEVVLAGQQKANFYQDEVLGLTVRDLTSEDYIQHRLPLIKGVLVVDASPMALMLGIRPGTIISEINREPAVNTQRYRELIGAAKRRGATDFLLYDNGRLKRVQVRMR